MNLIKHTGLPVYKNIKGFKYPQFFEHFKKHNRMYWNIDEIVLSKDIQDFNKASEEEKKTITEIMKLFTTHEVLVGHGYAVMLKIFKPTEVHMMLSDFMAREMIHIEAYSKFTETIGIGDEIYTEFLDIPVMSTKCTYLDKAKVKKYEDYKRVGLSDAEVDREFRRDVARMLAVYAGFTEGVSLYSQFATLLAYQFKNKYPGLCDIVLFSIKEEFYHNKANSELFRVYVSENLDIWDDALKYDIYQACREVVAYELNLIDYINPSHVNKTDLKDYVRYCADNALKELGMKPNWNIEKNPLGFMDDALGVIMTDFFTGTVTDYTKEVQGDFGSLIFSHWE
jgi:ribonucleoside-diphosphate reductase beta chain